MGGGGAEKLSIHPAIQANIETKSKLQKAVSFEGDAEENDLTTHNIKQTADSINETILQFQSLEFIGKKKGPHKDEFQGHHSEFSESKTYTPM